MMTSVIKGVGKGILFAVVFAVGVGLFLIIAGEYSAESGYSFDTYLIIKFGALVGAYLLYLICRRIYSKGLFPAFVYEELEGDKKGEEV